MFSLPLQKFNESGAVIKRGAFGLGEGFDKNFKCRDRFHVCCRKPFCNKDTAAPCPPPGKFPQLNIVHTFIPPLLSLSLFAKIAKITSKKEVKACYQCKGQEACKPEKLTGSEIRTSGAFGGKNLYCYTVSFTGPPR